VFTPEAINAEQMAAMVETAVVSGGLRELRNTFARGRAAVAISNAHAAGALWIVPPGHVRCAESSSLSRQRRDVRDLLDFYRIAWSMSAHVPDSGRT